MREGFANPFEPLTPQTLPCNESLAHHPFNPRKSSGYIRVTRVLARDLNVFVLIIQHEISTQYKLPEIKRPEFSSSI
jgi:hypothetical protein